MKSRKKAAKAVAPPQALFDSMDGEASSDASSPTESSAADVIAATDEALAGAEAQEEAAYAAATFAREDAAILGDPQQEVAGADEDAGGEDAGGSEEEESGVEDQRESEAPAQPVQAKSTMDAVALVFMEDAMARRLAVAWPVCKGDEEQWFDAAGFTPKQRGEALRIGRALRLNGICRDGGVTDPLALEYIQAVIVKPLNAARGKSAPAKK